ncbi:hypothetical protein VCBJG01_1876, partial [Vibrio cholerae BJG-01]
MMASSPIL